MISISDDDILSALDEIAAEQAIWKTEHRQRAEERWEEAKARALRVHAVWLAWNDFYRQSMEHAEDDSDAFSYATNGVGAIPRFLAGNDSRSGDIPPTPPAHGR